MSDNTKKFIAYINCENEDDEKVVRMSRSYENNGADMIFIYNHTELEDERDRVMELVRDVVRRVDIPVMVGCRVEGFEDIRKAFYTGAKYVVLQYGDVRDNELLKQCCEHFGRDSVVVEVNLSEAEPDDFFENSEFLKAENYATALLKHVEMSERFAAQVKNLETPVIIRDSLIRNDIATLISMDNVSGVATNLYKEKALPSDNLYTDGEVIPAGKDIMKVKRSLKNDGIDMDIFESSLLFSDLKKNSDNLIPCIVQDYKTDEVLMLAYMNEESFNKTIETGVMTYFSRSRQELWIKGGTSGHFQYVKELRADCDKDTLLAKVNQIGAACHTGSRSCFFNEMMKHEYDEKNVNSTLADLYNEIADRKNNQTEGSYTDYLCDNGTDDILKKCSEKMTGIVISAKNSNSEELKQEMADMLYNMTALMVESGVEWEDILERL